MHKRQVSNISSDLEKTIADHTKLVRENEQLRQTVRKLQEELCKSEEGCKMLRELGTPFLLNINTRDHN